MSFFMVFVNTFSMILLTIIVILLWKRRKESCSLQLFLATLFMLIWAIGTFAENVSTSESIKLIWRNFTQIGSFLAPIASLIFAISYTKYLLKYKKIVSRIIYTVEIIAVLLICTDSWHHIARVSVEYINHGSYITLVVNSTTLFKFLISLHFLYMIIAFSMLLIYYFNSTKTMKKQVLSMTLGMGISIGFSFLKIATSDSFITFVPISGIFALTALCMLLGIMKYDLLILHPIARNEVFNIIDDGIIIASEKGEIVDINNSALKMFNISLNNTKNIVLENFQKIISDLCPELCESISKNNAGKFNINFTNNNMINYLRCEIYNLYNSRKKVIGNVSVIKDITEQIIKNDLLKIRAEKDSLTNIYNRSTFVEKAEALLKNTDNNIALIFFDVDFFKNVNDKYGHRCGDYVLKELALCVQSMLDENYLFGRMGGEEFAVFKVLSDNEDSKAIYLFAEKIRNKIEIHTFAFNNILLKATISTGIAVNKNTTFDSLYSKADKNLYKAKGSGRNCSVI